MKQKEPKKSIIRIFHRIRIFVAIFLGIEHSRLSKLVCSGIYELRLMTLATTMVLSFYILTELLMDGTESELLKLIIKFNCLIVLVIFYLIIKILTKLKRHSVSECKYSSYNWEYINSLDNKEDLKICTKDREDYGCRK